MPYSRTKVPLSRDDLTAVVARAFGSGAGLADCHSLDDGSYNAVYQIQLTDGRDPVLKVAPPPSMKLLAHEVDLMRTEVEFSRLAEAAGVPVPGVFFADLTRSLVDRDYVFLHRVPGGPLSGADLPPDDLACLRREVGASVARLHTVTGPAFGYPLRGSRSWQPTWRAAYLAMLDDILADAVRLVTDLPAGPEEISTRLRRHATALDEVTRPALVHFDLWDGNIFVEGNRLTGLIDGERALYGDPYAEFISLALFRDITGMPELLDGYAQVAGPVEFTDAVRARLALYTCYLYLIMVTEGATRGFDPDDPVRRHARKLLKDYLDQL